MRERSILWQPRRLPWTLFVVSVLLVGAIASHTYAGPLAESWYQRMGSSPELLARGQWYRLLTSPILTPGAGRFYVSLVMAALCVGAAEWRYGSLRTALTFVGVHSATLSLIAVVIVAASYFHVPFAAILYDVVDVGPSAGYYGCLGLVLAGHRSRTIRVSAIVVAAILVLRLVGSAMTLPEQGRTLSADLAHAVAFPLGCLSSTIRTQESKHGATHRSA